MELTLDGYMLYEINEIGREGRLRNPQLSSRNRGLTDGFHQLQVLCC
jgi:hypothetical protein